LASLTYAAFSCTAFTFAHLVRCAAFGHSHRENPILFIAIENASERDIVHNRRALGRC
jgi:hypothetical protein